MNPPPPTHINEYLKHATINNCTRMMLWVAYDQALAVMSQT